MSSFVIVPIPGVIYQHVLHNETPLVRSIFSSSEPDPEVKIPDADQQTPTSGAGAAPAQDEVGHSLGGRLQHYLSIVRVLNNWISTGRT